MVVSLNYEDTVFFFSKKVNAKLKQKAISALMYLDMKKSKCI